jgi:hypothetical protein
MNWWPQFSNTVSPHRHEHEQWRFIFKKLLTKVLLQTRTRILKKRSLRKSFIDEVGLFVIAFLQ